MTLPFLPCLVRHLLRQIGGTVWEKFDKELGGTEIKPGDDQSLLDTNYITQLMSSVSEEFRGVGAGVDVVFGCGVVVDGDGCGGVGGVVIGVVGGGDGIVAVGWC